jgi:predicted secreted protein/uncharacterized lipoprotein NlpE involved in copper resistance
LKPFSNNVAVASLCLALLTGIARTQTKTPAIYVAEPSQLLTRFAGVLPCADCSGLKTELRLFTGRPSGRPDHYEMTETYLATRDGDKAFLSAGNWAILRGTSTNRNATVYQLDFDQPNRRRNFLLTGDELRSLDRDLREIQSPMPLSLRKTPGGQSETVVLLERDSGKTFHLKQGQTVSMRLDSNRTTGFTWILTPAPGNVLTELNDPIYSAPANPSGAVGRGGVEYSLFAVSAKGMRSLRLEYRRPQEKIPAKVINYMIVVE